MKKTLEEVRDQLNVMHISGQILVAIQELDELIIGYYKCHDNLNSQLF